MPVTSPDPPGLADCSNQNGRRLRSRNRHCSSRRRCHRSRYLRLSSIISIVVHYHQIYFSLLPAAAPMAAPLAGVLEAVQLPTVTPGAATGYGPQLQTALDQYEAMFCLPAAFSPATPVPANYTGLSLRPPYKLHLPQAHVDILAVSTSSDSQWSCYACHAAVCQGWFCCAQARASASRSAAGPARKHCPAPVLILIPLRLRHRRLEALRLLLHPQVLKTADNA